MCQTLCQTLYLQFLSNAHSIPMWEYCHFFEDEKAD